MFQLLRRFFAPRSSANVQRVTTRPNVEALEDRWTPAAIPVLSGGVLSVTGSSLADSVRVTINDASNLITVQSQDAVSSSVNFFAASTVNTINVHVHGGNDVVNINLASDMTRADGVGFARSRPRPGQPGLWSVQVACHFRQPERPR